MPTKPLPRGIRMRGDTFMVDVTVRGVRRTGTASTRTDAIALQASLRTEIGATSGAKVGQAWTLGEAFDKACETVWDEANSKSGLSLQRTAKHAVGHFGRTMRVDEIDMNALDGFVKALRHSGNSNATINRKLAAISRILTVAQERGGLHSKPKIPKQKEPVGRVRFVSREEEAEIIATMEKWGQLDLLDAYIVLVDTGIRRGELFKLTPPDVSAAGDSITLWVTKSDAPRTVPLTTRAQVAIARRLKGTSARNNALFDFSPRWLNANWDRVRYHLDLHDVNLHKFRHTCASRLVQNGVDIAVVQKWLGHKTISVTLKYAHLAPKNLTNAVQALELN